MTEHLTNCLFSCNFQDLRPIPANISRKLLLSFKNSCIFAGSIRNGVKASSSVSCDWNASHLTD